MVWYKKRREEIKGRGGSEEKDGGKNNTPIVFKLKTTSYSKLIFLL